MPNTGKRAAADLRKFCAASDLAVRRLLKPPQCFVRLKAFRSARPQALPQQRLALQHWQAQ